MLHDKANNWQRLTGTSLDLAQPSLSLHHPHCLLLAKKNFEFGCLKSSHKSCSSKCFSHMKMILQALPAMDGQLSDDTDECKNLLELGALCMFSSQFRVTKTAYLCCSVMMGGKQRGSQFGALMSGVGCELWQNLVAVVVGSGKT